MQHPPRLLVDLHALRDAPADDPEHLAACNDERGVLAPGRGEEIEKAACDRLAQLYEEGKLVDKDNESAYFFASLACERGGFEHDHAACIRRGVFISKGMGERADDAHEYFYGIVGDPVNRKECERPSVKEACEREKSHVPPGR